jgi:hypothetical protein
MLTAAATRLSEWHQQLQDICDLLVCHFYVLAWLLRAAWVLLLVLLHSRIKYVANVLAHLAALFAGSE